MLPEAFPVESFDQETEAIAIPLVVDDDATGPVVVAPEKLVCVVGNDLGRTFVIRKAPLVIGRGAADIDLRSTDVSRCHARITRNGRSLMVEDLGSANGTIVNGSPITRPTVIQPGDRIQIGSTILVMTRHDELEDRLQQLQKLDAMGALVKGLAHDFNNVLTVVQAGLDELAERRDDDPVSRQLIADMSQAATSAAGLVRRLLRMGRNKPATSELVELKSIVAESLAMARRLGMDRIRFTVDVADGLMVRGSRDELTQIFLNLIINARDAMPDGGQLLIQATSRQLDRAGALARQLAVEGRYIDIAVVDNGIGMDDSTRARIFEPFFTTKRSDKGNGLGLAMIYSSIRNHQGTIHVESELGRGTTFRILIPAAC